VKNWTSGLGIYCIEIFSEMSLSLPTTLPLAVENAVVLGVIYVTSTPFWTSAPNIRVLCVNSLLAHIFR
jgi:hypothetical protein